MRLNNGEEGSREAKKTSIFSFSIYLQGNIFEFIIMTVTTRIAIAIMQLQTLGQIQMAYSRTGRMRHEQTHTHITE